MRWLPTGYLVDYHYAVIINRSLAGKIRSIEVVDPKTKKNTKLKSLAQAYKKAPGFWPICAAQKLIKQEGNQLCCFIAAQTPARDSPWEASIMDLETLGDEVNIDVLGLDGRYAAEDFCDLACKLVLEQSQTKKGAA
jgi:hypothetical protein